MADFNDEEKLGKGKEMQDRLSKLVGDLRRPRLPRPTAPRATTCSATPTST